MEDPVFTAEEQATIDAARAVREEAEAKEKANTIDGQAEIMREAIKEALNEANRTIVANGGKPSIDAVIRATVSIQADFIAMQPDRRARRMQIGEIVTNLPRFISLRVGAQ
ncbi:hypothetical protein LJR231_002252 [Phyllobacterium sp. LjRoot231]|uniref:hypothetical protein n=1 Tax=Phyllobacterium sp. LjRoot231 TaxID=3342289 RepID=UPI003ECEA414